MKKLFITAFTSVFAWQITSHEHRTATVPAECNMVAVEVLPAAGNLGLKGKILPFVFQTPYCSEQKLQAGDTVQVRFDLWMYDPEAKQGDWVIEPPAGNRPIRTDRSLSPIISEYYKGIVHAVWPIPGKT